MRDIVDHYAERGYRALDLGIGSDDYKRLFCKSDEPIFDCFIPLSLRGKVAAAAMSGINRAKHLVKHNPALFQLAQKLRSALHRIGPQPHPEERAFRRLEDEKGCGSRRQTRLLTMRSQLSVRHSGSRSGRDDLVRSTVSAGCSGLPSIVNSVKQPAALN
jgi:hypothetical protein